MTEPSDQPGHDIRIGDRVTLRGSDPPKVGHVIELLSQGEGFVEAGVPQPGGPANMAWVSWKDQTKRSAERLADLIKLTEGNNQQ